VVVVPFKVVAVVGEAAELAVVGAYDVVLLGGPMVGEPLEPPV